MHSSFQFVLRVVKRLPSVIVLGMCLGIASLVIVSPVAAQNSLGSIQGTITDKTQAPVPGATVSIINTETNVSVETRTNEQGFYSVGSLIPGAAYRVIAKCPGFEVVDTFPVSASTGDTTTIDLVLPVGKENVTVTVSADEQLLSRDSSVASTNLDQVLTENLPYPEQGTLEVALLAPGVKGSELDPQGLASENPGIYIGSVSPGAQISINGVPAGHTAILADGSDVTQTSYSRAGITISSGMISQTTVLTAGLPAQYGRTMGGIIIQSTRSGTNLYHGMLSWRHTDPSMQAHPDGQAVPADLHQNFFGAFIGGPLRIPRIYDGRNKTFFYVGVEPSRIRNQTSYYTQVPLPAELAGNFYDDITLLDPSVIASSGYAAARQAPRTQALHYQSTPNAAGFPFGPQLTSTQYTLIPNDDVSAQLAQNSFAKFVVSKYPSLNNPQLVQFLNADGFYSDQAGPTLGNNANVIRGVINADNRYSVRVDQNAGSHDRLYGRFSHTPLTASRTTGFTVDNPLESFPQDKSFASDAIVDETHVFTSSLVNEVRVSYLRNDQNRLPPEGSLTTDFAAKYGLTPAAAGAGFPSLAGIIFPAGTNQIQRNVDVVSQLQDDITLLVGKHKLMFGTDLRHLQSNLYTNPGLYGGNYNFSTNQTNGCSLAYYAKTTTTCSSGGGNALASLILGAINTFSFQNSQVPSYYRWHYYAGYFQDDWRVSSNLTLNLGLRYEYESPRMEKYDRQGTFIPSISGSLNNVAATGAFCFTNSCGLGHTIFPQNYRGFEPRIGFALSLNRRTVVHGSYAIMRTPLTGLANFALPNFGVNATSVTSASGGQNGNYTTNYITNPVASTPTAVISLLSKDGPNFTVPGGLAIPYVSQSNAIPYTQQWYLGVQVQLARSTIVSAAYAGSHSVHTFNNFEGPENIPSPSVILAQIASGAKFSTTVPNPYGITQNGSVQKESYIQSLSPYQNFFNQPSPSAGAGGAGEGDAEIGELYNRQGAGSYNSLYLAGTQHVAAGLSLQASFTWSKTMDTLGTDPAGAAAYGGVTYIQNPFETTHTYSVSDYDIPAYIRVGANYQLPLGYRAHYRLPTSTASTARNIIDRVGNLVLGDVSTGDIFRAESSVPFIPTLGQSTYPSSGPVGWWFGSDGTSALPPGYWPRPNYNPAVPCINPNWHRSPGDRWNDSYINAAAFSVPGSLGAPAFGNAPRTMANCRSPREVFFDANITKTIPIGKDSTKSLRLTMQAFNAFNHPLFYFNGASTNNSQGNNGKIFESCSTTTLTCPVSPFFGTVNPSFTSQFSRYLQVSASFNF